MATAGTLENPSNQKNNMTRDASQVWEEYKNGDFHCTDLFHGKVWMPTESRVLHFTSMTQNGHFKGRHERKMSALALCGSDHRGRRFIIIQAAVTVAEQWKERKKWLRWQTKIDLALFCAFYSPHPSVFNFQNSTRMEEVEKRLLLREGEETGKGRCV